MTIARAAKLQKGQMIRTVKGETLTVLDVETTFSQTKFRSTPKRDVQVVTVRPSGQYLLLDPQDIEA